MMKYDIFIILYILSNEFDFFIIQNLL